MTHNTVRAATWSLLFLVALAAGCNSAIRDNYGMPVKLGEYHHVLVGPILPAVDEPADDVRGILRTDLAASLEHSDAWQRRSTWECWRPVEIRLEDVKLASSGGADGEGTYRASCRLVVLDPLTDQPVGTARVEGNSGHCPPHGACGMGGAVGDAPGVGPTITSAPKMSCEQCHPQRRAIAHLAAAIVDLLARHRPPEPPQPAIASGC